MEAPEPIELFKSRDFGNELSLTFNFFRDNFKLLGKSIILVAGPVLLLASVIYGYLMVDLEVMGDYGTFWFGSIMGPLLLSWLIMLIAFALLTTVINEYVALYAEKGPGNFTFEDVWAETRRDMFRIALTIICSTLVIMFMSILLIIPGLYFAGVLSIVTMVQVYERCSMGEAFSRSFELVKGRWWLAFGMLIVPTIISSFLRSAFNIPMIFSMVADGFGSHGRSHHFSIFTLITTVISTFGGFLCSAVPIVGTSLNYFNLREKHEGVGLMRRIQSIGGGDPDANEQSRSADASGW